MTTCSVKWCVALAVNGGTECAVHVERGIGFRVGETGEPSTHCDTCGGTRECVDCDGEGTHVCEHANCYDEHGCPTCDGTGECPECEEDDEEASDALYIAFAFDAGCAPLPPLYDNPWDVA